MEMSLLKDFVSRFDPQMDPSQALMGVVGKRSEYASLTSDPQLCKIPHRPYGETHAERLCVGLGWFQFDSN